MSGAYPINAPDFTYDFDSNPAVSSVRLLVSDTTNFPSPPFPLFLDAEITAALQMSSSQGIYVSAMAISGGYAMQPPVLVLSYYRAAALLLNALAANKALLSSVTKLLDVSLSPDKAALQLRTTADDYRTIAANDGSFAIAEMVVNNFSARERLFKQLLRIEGG
jgi:hypothetical protein